MKKIYFLFLLFALSLLQAQIINIPDANFKAKLLSANTSNGVAKNSAGQNIVLDANSNSEIEVSEALNVYRLEFYSSTISNITGITSFSNLTNLKMGSIAATTINLNGLNNLQVLDMSSFNALSTLNISNFSNLQNFKIGYCSNLTTLTLQNLPALSQLTINTNNSLNNLTISNFPVLAAINCTSNYALTNLTIQNCSATTGIDLGNNSLSMLQLSTLPLLQNLVLNNNELTVLDLSNFSNLQSLSAVGNFLATADLNANPLLHTVYLSDNLLQSIKIKNGGQNFPSTFQIFDNVPFQYLCCDAEDIPIATSNINQQGYTSATVDSSCPVTLLSIAETSDKSEQISFYPNPVKDILYFKSKEKIVKVEIYDVAGRILKSQNINGSSINVSELSKGKYIIKIYKKNRFITEKFIKN
ncbi:T9SS type A sorting domain-containing protein [Chryseobacterium sp. C-71]|uniref:T9SS type A sorting domain-containing protein n=1 Tax=Chryseobacterium sp. C-71 TaxID=2893882 RepID=UPI001E48CE58|nr:T9SS type A sorting domain-containing protein [Chryseobacterium sp. C-71]UFH31479.1 T9SS type A sorting domain-containing protein [Chryseobacterium sp. C-71]